MRSGGGVGATDYEKSPAALRRHRALHLGGHEGLVDFDAAEACDPPLDGFRLSVDFNTTETADACFC